MFTYNIYYHTLILFIIQFASWVKLTFNNEDEFLFTPKIKSLLMGAIPGFFLGIISGYIIFGNNGIWLGIASGIVSGSMSCLIALLFFNLRMWIRKRKENKKNNKRSKKQKIYK